MSDKTKENKDKQEGTVDTAGSQMPVTVLSQYIRDVSFENPNAPESLDPSKGAPDMDMSIGMDARKIPHDKYDNMYEVVLSARATATRDDLPLFVLEIQYGMTVLVDESIPEDNIHPLLFIEMPHLCFPYVRMLVGTLTAHGGFPPLYLTPVDFQSLYMERFAEEIKRGQEQQKEAAQTTLTTKKS